MRIIYVLILFVILSPDLLLSQQREPFFTTGPPCGEGKPRSAPFLVLMDWKDQEGKFGKYDGRYDSGVTCNCDGEVEVINNWNIQQSLPTLGSLQPHEGYIERPPAQITDAIICQLPPCAQGLTAVFTSTFNKITRFYDWSVIERNPFPAPGDSLGIQIACMSSDAAGRVSGLLEDECGSAPVTGAPSGDLR